MSIPPFPVAGSLPAGPRTYPAVAASVNAIAMDSGRGTITEGNALVQNGDPIEEFEKSLLEGKEKKKMAAPAAKGKAVRGLASVK